jgi:hypothetical protein
MMSRRGVVLSKNDGSLPKQLLVASDTKAPLMRAETSLQVTFGLWVGNGNTSGSSREEELQMVL